MQRCGPSRTSRVVIALAAVLPCSMVAAVEPAAARRNVLLVICDDLCCALGCYGDAAAKTPHVDGLAARGVRFDRAYCQFPLCNPSRASLLTGRRPARTGVRDNGRRFRDVDGSVVTLPQVFRNAGWRSERIGKLFHYGVPGQIGTDGLDDPPSWDAVFNPQGRDVADEARIFSLEPGKFGGTVSWLAAEGTDAEQTDGIAAARAVKRLEAFARDKTPFFLAVGFYRPHTPYVAPQAWFERHPLGDVRLPEVPADHDARVPPPALGSRKPEQARLAGDLGREALQAYRASVSFVDAQAGIVLDALDRLGLADNTVVVFTSDHGYHLGEHGLWQKQSLFEESARVPLVIAAPGGRAGAVDGHTVELIDVLPTVCDLAGVPAPPGVDGRSLAPLVRGDDAAREGFPDRPAFTEVGKPGEGRRGTSVRSGRWRYTVWRGGGRQLYDHAADPRELDNLAERPEHAAIVRELDTVIRSSHVDDRPAAGPAASAPARPPNVVVILADDLGFSDLGCYGGEIDTPHLDRLAAGGLRFTQGYSTARCWPSRAALLTGYYAQAVGRDALPGGKGGTQGRRPAWASLLPERLAPAGYRSYHSGKWHVDGDPRTNGFARSLDAGAGGQNNYFAASGVSVDGRPLEDRAGFYATTAIGDHAVDCLAGHARDHGGTPFFHYVAFTAPHFPLQAPPELVAKYRERYRAGWDAVRAARCRRVRELGLVTTEPSAPEPGVGPPYPPPPEMLARLGPGELDRPRPWEELTAEQREFQAGKMAIHAAMVEAMDREVGRIVAQLEAMHALDDTLILFASDNGASAEILIRGEGHDPAAEPGSRRTFLCLGPGWSTCANAPFRRHKTWVHEGGIATPWIIHWPRGIATRGGLRRQMVHLVDVAPTVLELAAVAPPHEHAGVTVPPMQGRSFAAALGDAPAPAPHESLWWCHEGNRAVRDGDWKLVAAKGRPWELYDLATDRCETTDLAAREPDRVRDLEAKWEAIAGECRALAAGRETSPSASTAGPSAAPPATTSTAAGARSAAKRPPNVVIVFCDDLGYGDPSCYGGKTPTPHIDRIAREGIRFTDFHVPHPVCSASRAALLTGCYSPRVSIHGALFPAATHGIAAGETTLAELLRDRGYRTAAVGKWHLGHLPEFLPTRHGFDEWLGLPYSNDMWPANGGRHPPLPLFDGETVVDADVTAEDQALLTGRYAGRAVDFIERAAQAGDGRPFFLYLAHSMPHVPLFAGAEFRGRSAAGLYGDVVAEIDASVGGILEALDRTGAAENTLVLFTSDNGPWLQFGDHGGSAGPLREGKGTVFEGGIRVPCVARLPGVIPAGTVSDALLCSIDVLPTVAALSGDPLPVDGEGFCVVAGKRIDGHDRRAAFANTEDAAVGDGVTHWYYYGDGALQAVRRGRWKLLLPHEARITAGQQPGGGGRSGKTAPLRVGRELYDLRDDSGERTNVVAAHPEVVADLERVAERARLELGDALTGRKGVGVRPPGGTAGRPGDAQPAPRPAGKGADAPARGRPNIIYVMTDDQGYGDIAAHGNRVIQTPHLDRLRGESVRLTEFHASPTCSPTRAALMTGRHEFRSGVTHTIHERERLALTATTLPQLLKTAGYATGIFGKWHLGDEDAYQPGKRGFDRVFIHGAGGIGQSYPGSCGDVPGNSYFDPMIRSDGKFVKTKGYCTDVFFDAALDWIDRRRREKQPFFCYVTPNCPHGPYDCPPGADEKYLVPLEEAGITDPKQRATIARFYAMIENIDTNMGRLLAKLDEWGLVEDTLVVFTTDNGTAAGGPVFNDGMRGTKGMPYRGGTRVPAFWRWPGTLPAGVDVAAVTAHIDVLPTLCELAGVVIPAAVAAQVEGRSMVPLLENAEAEWPDRPLVSHVGRWERGKAAESAYRNCRIREGRWQLVNTKNRPGTWELFDLAADPGEQHDVAAKHPDVIARLGRAYDAWWASVQGDLVNEDLDGPKDNPFKVAFRDQFGADATAAPAGAREPAAPASEPARWWDKAVAPQPVPPTLADVRYGDHPKQVLHFWKAPTATAEKPAPLVFFVHGGGWQGGDRMSSLAPMLESLLAAGLSVTSVEYRFIAEAMEQRVEPPVKAPLTDAARALQLVRSRAAEWHVDKTRVAASGGSAGACTSLWLAFHDDLADPASADPIARESTRLLAAAVSGAQTTLDPAQMKEWTPNSRYGGHAFGFMRSPERRDTQFADFLAARDRLLPEINRYSPYALVTADDPPVYLWYAAPPALGKDARDPTHTANFGLKLKERLDAVGVPCELVYPNAPDVAHPRLEDYLLETLVGVGAKAVP